MWRFKIWEGRVCQGTQTMTDMPICQLVRSWQKTYIVPVAQHAMMGVSHMGGVHYILHQEVKAIRHVPAKTAQHGHRRLAQEAVLHVCRLVSSQPVQKGQCQLVNLAAGSVEQPIVGSMPGRWWLSGRIMSTQEAHTILSGCPRQQAECMHAVGLT